MLYFTRWKALAIILTALVVCLFAVPNFFPESQGEDLAGVGAAPHRARPRFAGRLVPAARSRFQLREEGKARSGARRRPPRAARRQDRLYRPCRRAPTPSKSASQGDRSAGGAHQAARAVAAARRPARLQRAAQPRSLGCRRRADPSHGAAGRHHRPHPANDRTVDPDRRAPHQRTRHGRAADPAAGHRPHPGPGAGLAGSDRAEAHPRQDRQDGIPHGRSVGVAGSGAAGAGAGRFGSPDERAIAEGALRHQEAGAGFRRRPDRCAAGLRPAHQRADRQLQVQQFGLAQIRAGDVGECRACRLRSSSTTR